MITSVLFTDLQSFRSSLNASFLERTPVIDGILASMITKQNAFLFGLPGTGKSELVRACAQGFKNTKFFSYLLSPTTDPSELYGPVAVSKLLKDEYTRDISGYLPDANVCFLDELFRGSSAVLNSLLQVLNERTFNNGRDLITTDIQSIVAATNSFPTEESLQAFCDRFLFRPTVEGLKSPVSKRKLYEWTVRNNRPEIKSDLDITGLRELQEQVNDVIVSDEFLDVFSECMDMLGSRGLVISDRRRVQILTFLRGWAIVQGEEEVIPEYLHDTLQHICYQTPDDISVIKEVVNQCVPTAEQFFNEAKRTLNGVMGQYQEEVSGKPANVGDINRRVMSMKSILVDLENLQVRTSAALDSKTMRLSAAMRLKATKILTEIEAAKDRVTGNINRYMENN